MSRGVTFEQMFSSKLIVRYFMPDIVECLVTNHILKVANMEAKSQHVQQEEAQPRSELTD
jgi:hypothetical protein